MTSNKLSFFERANNWVRNSITLRLVTITILILLLLIPVNMIQQLIEEREDRQREAITEVSSKWGNDQIINGLVLTVPYKSYSKVYDDDREEYKWVESKSFAHFLPEDLIVKGEVLPEIRYRGIFEVVLYKANLNLSGTFSKPSFERWKMDDSKIIWEEAFISLGVSDLRGLQENVEVSWNGNKYEFNPGVESNDVVRSGISTSIPINQSDSSEIVSFSLDLRFNGSSSLSFMPLGKRTAVSLKSPWEHPSYDGAFLPDNREVSQDGFTAEWEVLHLNRPYPQQFQGSVSDFYSSSFGVNLIVPMDEYQKSMRSAKYAVMFITLTFLIFFFVQILNGVRIHPIQYIIVGLALCVFYTLLLSLSEHMAFKLSYLISSLAIISLITFYANAVFKDGKITKLIGLILVMLYLFIFVIIQMEDFALLMGSIGLFLVLATIMYLSRKIDWYAIRTEKE
mgnify:CR=1 FL=1